MAWLSKKITDWFIENDIINTEDRELYTYGLQQGLVIIANIITTVLIGLLFEMVGEAVLFMATYATLRSFAGGYHARTQLGCYLLSIVLISVVLLAIKSVSWTPAMILALTLIAGIIIFWMVPVEDSNKPLEQIEVEIYKKKSRMILLVEAGVMVLMMVLGFYQGGVCIAISLWVLSGMLVMGRFKSRVVKNLNNFK